MNNQELKELRLRQELELKKMGINNMEELQKAMDAIKLDISLMVAPVVLDVKKEIA